MAAEPVPVDILLTPPATVLVITGPEHRRQDRRAQDGGPAGADGPGRPARSGRPRLAGSRSSGRVFADIGDEQSIAANLSTFSWHITNIASMDRLLALPALVLFDELGSGTDPVEGGALAVALVDHFRTRGAIVICTSHADPLKTYATTTHGVAVAAFGFDPATLRADLPTGLRVAGTQPRARDRGAAGAAARGAGGGA